MKRNEMRDKLRGVFISIAEVLDQVNGDIEEIRKKVDQHTIVFLYGAGKNSQLVVNSLEWAIRGKECYFIDRDPSKRGKEILPGLFCFGVEKMFGKGRLAVVVITPVSGASEIACELQNEFYQIDKRLREICIIDELPGLLERKRELLEGLHTKSNVMHFFDLLLDEESRNLIYRDFRRLKNGYTFSDLLIEDYPVVNENFFPDIFRYGFSSNKNIICSGLFLKDTIDAICSMTKQYLKLYVFELNRLYMEEQLFPLLDPRFIFANAGLAADTKRVTREIENCDVMTHRYLDYCSDDFLDMKSVDDLIQGGMIKGQISLVCLSVLGAEAAALYGMKEMIRRDKPMFAIRIYHRCDFSDESSWELAFFLKKLVPEYKFLLRDFRYRSLEGRMLYVYVDYSAGR